MPLLRLVFPIGLALAAAATAILLPHSPAGLRELVLSVGPAAPLAALAAWVLLTPALFPGTVLAAAGGLTFGAAGGAALAFGGALAGGLAAFALARGCASGAAARLVARSPRLAKIEAHLQRRGFAAILAARLTPGVPATGLYYLAGASRVHPGAFLAAMAVAAPLRTVPYAVLGTGLVALGAVASALLFRQVLRATPLAPVPGTR
jgi:uncharacterized membrane protein YdjX (TVP38/TMEM64 family)